MLCCFVLVFGVFRTKTINPNSCHSYQGRWAGIKIELLSFRFKSEVSEVKPADTSGLSMWLVIGCAFSRCLKMPLDSARRSKQWRD